MLKRVHIKGYKSLSNVEVQLSPLTLLFGPNAAGKSNFLDALQLLSKLATSRTLKEAFDPPYRGKPLESFAIGEKGLKGMVQQERLIFSIEADLDLSDGVVEAVNRQGRCGVRATQRQTTGPPLSANATCATEWKSRCNPDPGLCASRMNIWRR